MSAQPNPIIVQEPFNPELVLVIDLTSKASFVDRPPSTDCGRDAMEFLTEKFVDFESLKLNGVDIQDLFFDQKWENYFNMLNGFVYYDIVKNFWHKAYVFDKSAAEEEVRKMVKENKALKGKTRAQLGLRPFRGKEIRSNLLGIDVLITQEHVAKILSLDNQGQDVNSYNKNSMYSDSIRTDLYPAGTTSFGKAKLMKPEFDLAFRVLLGSIIPRKGGKDTVSIPHQHFLWFMHKRVKINLASLLFEHLCSSIIENQHKAIATLHHPRLISEIIRQTKLIEIIRQKERLRVFQTAKLDATILVNMKKKTDDEIIKAENPLKTIYETYFWCDGFPTISEHDNEEVIKNFLIMVRLETGVRVPRSMVVGVPDWDIFKGPKDSTKSRKKPRLVEQALLEDSEQSNNDKSEDDNVDGTADQVDSGAEESAAENKARMKEEAAERALQKEKEIRSKKRNDRPPTSEEDQNPAKPAKRFKTRASKPQGKLSKSNTYSIPVAQDVNSQPQPSNAQTSTSQPSDKPNPIDFTVPLSVVLPDSNPISTSSSSDTSTDSEELIAKLTKEVKEKQKKIHLKRTTKRTIKKPIQISSDEEPTIIIDTTILNQPANTESVLDHLQQHLSGDAFTHSNPNSPHHFSFINTTADSIAQEPPTIQAIQTPPSSLDHISQENPPTFTPIQDETIAHSEAQQESPHHSPDNVIAEQQPPSPQPEFSTPEPSPKPSPEPIYDPLNRPLDAEEISELYEHIFKVEEKILKDAIDIDDEPPIPYDLSKIKIINLKRKKPEPTIPFDPSKPFFNSDSDPNLELLNNAIGLRLKKFKQMDEEALVFPSDFDAEVIEMEYLFSQSLKILSTHLKNKTQGRGMNTVRELFEIAERSRAPRITFFNHEAEQARIAAEAEQKRQAEIEHKRLADQEALKLLVSRGTHIATIETNKILADQVVAEHIALTELIQYEQEDIAMPDQSPVVETPDKGKAAIVDKTPPASPKIEKGSPSSDIPPAVQRALDTIRTELAEDFKDEIDELRADLRTDFRADITASEEVTRQRMDAMMETLLKAIADIKKP
ncbi:hypothetical protein QL285_043196 [Trifolium repens]|nr:hypothetical protein QL285_043196 [Trifolium repens]